MDMGEDGKGRGDDDLCTNTKVGRRGSENVKGYCFSLGNQITNVKAGPDSHILTLNWVGEYAREYKQSGYCLHESSEHSICLYIIY